MHYLPGNRGRHQDRSAPLTGRNDAATLEEWGDRRACTRMELESLIGLLNHACKVVRPGRSLLSDLLYSVQHPPNSVIPIRLTCEFRSDMA